MAPAPFLELKGVEKTFPLASGGLKALSPIDLRVARGEFVTLVGESGCGKSTLLRLMGGLEIPSAGRIELKGRGVTGPGLERGLIFQEPRLFPWMTAKENVAFGCPAGLAAGEVERTVREHLALVGLKGFEKAYPRQLSGGMQQRAALARALVAKPELLLLDEPFGALDALTRLRMQEEILRIWQKEGTTMVLVTHDIEEAVFLGDRVLVMGPRPGSLKRVVPVKLKRPRDRNGPGFAQLRRVIQAEFF